MDPIQLDFEQAKAKHLLFKSRLRSILYGGETDEAPVLSHYECAVGKWIYGHALKDYGHIPEMNELERVHADIHTSARHLVELYKEGKVEEARKGLIEMEKVADHLVQLLGEVEKKVEAEPDILEKVIEYQAVDVSLTELNDLLKANEQLDKTIRAQSGELIKERQVLHDFFMQAPAILAIVRGPEHIFELANPAYRALIGNRNPVGKSVREAMPELEGQGFYELLDNVFKTGEPFTGNEMPAFLDRGNGALEQLYFNFIYQAFTNADGTIDGVLVFAYEVTEQVTARRIIEESEKRAKFITEAMPQKVWTADKEGNITYCNQHWMDFTGRSFEQLKEWGWQDIIHPDDLAENLRLWKHSIATGEDFQFEHRFKRHDGEYRWHLSRGIPQKDDAGNVTMWVGTNTDIHDNKMLGEQLQESYNDLEMKVTFRNLELERANKENLAKIDELQKKLS